MAVEVPVADFRDQRLDVALAGVPGLAVAALVPRRWLERILVQSLFNRLPQVRVEGLPAGLPELDTVVLGRVVARRHCNPGVGVLPCHRPSDSRRRRTAEVDHVDAALSEPGHQRRLQVLAARSRVPAHDHPLAVDAKRRPTESATSAVTVSPTGPRIPLVPNCVITALWGGRP